LNEVKKYSKLGIEKIKSVNILDKKDTSELIKLNKELQRCYEVNQIWRTETEMRYSILNDTKFPTPASKYWQSLREQMVFFTNLVYLGCDYDEKQGELELKEVEFEEIIKDKSKKSRAKQRIVKAQINRMKYQLMEMRLHGHDRVREITLWEQLKNEQKKKAKFDINDVNKHQKETFEMRWQKEIVIATQTNNPSLFKHSKENLETLKADKDKLLVRG